MSVQPIPSPAKPDEPVAGNRAARRRKGKTTDPALLQHGLADQAARARTTARGRRINPVRRTG
jgi:hypothetical protein